MAIVIGDTMIKINKKRTTFKELLPEGYRVILGIDPSTKTGWACVHIDPDGDITAIFKGTLKFPPQKGFKRHKDVYDALKELLDTLTPTTLVLEGYSHASKFSNTLQPELGAIARLLSEQLHIPTIQVAPTTLKKFVTGKGNSKKDIMMKEVYKRWFFEGTDDECDAFSLVMFGKALLISESMTLPKVNMSAVGEWRKNNDKLGRLKFEYEK